MKQVWENYRRTFVHRDARRILIGDAVSKAGDWLLYIAMSLLLFRTSGIAALGAFNALRVIVPVAFGPYAGRWSSKFNPRTVMVCADLARALVLIAAGVLGEFRAPIALLLGLVFLNGFASSWYGPAERRLQRDLISPEERGAFNAALSSTGTLVLVLAPALGGLVSVWTSPYWLLWFDAISFLATAALVSRVRVPATVQSTPAATKNAWSAALRSVAADRVVTACFVCQTAACTGVGASLVLLLPIAIRTTGHDTGLGWLTAAIGIGSVIGTIVGSPVAQHANARIGALSIVGMGLLLGLLGSSGNLACALAIALALGLAANIPEPLYWTAYANRIPEEELGAVYGLADSAITAAMIVGSVAAGTTAAILGATWASWLIGLLIGSVAVVALALAWHTVESAPSSPGETAPVEAPAAQLVGEPAC